MVQQGGGGRRSRNSRSDNPLGEQGPPSQRSSDRTQAREERRQKANRRLLMVVVGVVTLLVLLVAAVVFWPEDKQTPPSTAPIAPVVETKTGPPLRVTSIDGFSFQFAGVRAVVNGRTVGAEYTITNVGTQEALFEMPVDLYVRRDRVPKGTLCNRRGAPSGSCSPRNKASVVGPVGTSPQLRTEGADLYMPPGSTYLVRMTMVVPMDQGVSAGDVSLSLWSSRFYPDQVGHPLPFPN